MMIVEDNDTKYIAWKDDKTIFLDTEERGIWIDKHFVSWEDLSEFKRALDKAEEKWHAPDVTY